MVKKNQPTMTDDDLKQFLESSIKNVQHKINALKEDEILRCHGPTYEKGILEGMQTAYRVILIKKGLWNK